MEGTEKREVVASVDFFISINQIYEYGKETFGVKKAIEYEKSIYAVVEKLSTDYSFYPECPYMPTKDKRYRRINLPAHFIIYRIYKRQIQILNIYHQSVSITTTKTSRKIKP